MNKIFLDLVTVGAQLLHTLEIILLKDNENYKLYFKDEFTSFN